MNYLPSQIEIKIYIPTSEIEATDYIKLYDVTADPSGEGTLIATLHSSLADPDPSIGESYLFQYRYFVTAPGTYDLRYTIYDERGNEGSTSEVFYHNVCLVPRTPVLGKPSWDEGVFTFGIS